MATIDDTQTSKYDLSGIDPDTICAAPSPKHDLTDLFDLAERGYRLHPCNGKIAILTGWPELAATEHNVITQMWTEYRDAWPAIATGGTIGVLDIDDLGAFVAWCKENGILLQPTVTVKTPRGLHLYFTVPDGHRFANWTKVIPGCDYRGDGGYVISPCSWNAYAYAEGKSFNDLEVAAMPDWLLKACNARTEPIERESSEIPEGGRNDGLAREAGKLRHKGHGLDFIAEELLAINQARCNPPLPASEVREIAGSISRYDTGAELEAATVESCSTPKYQWAYMEDFLEEDILPVRTLIGPVEERGGCLISAGKGDGKTLVAQTMTLGLVTAIPVFGRGGPQSLDRFAAFLRWSPCVDSCRVAFGDHLWARAQR